MPKPTKQAPSITSTLPPATVLSEKAQALFDDVASRWELSPPVKALLTLACESMTRAEQCDEITGREGLTLRDMKGSTKAHPLALLARDMRNHASTALQRLLAHLG